MKPTDNELTLDELMDAHAPSLYRYAARLVCDTHAARDVVQQVFIRFSRLKPAERPALPATRSWLYRATHNRAVDHIRAEQRRKNLHQAHSEIEAATRPTKHDDRVEAVLRWVHVLKENERAVLLLRLQEGLSYKEISEVTGHKEGQVGWLLHQAVTTLSEKLQREEGT